MGSVSLILMYEPPLSEQGPIALVRVENASLAAIVARVAIAEAELRAAEFAHVDDFLGEYERAEVQRLRVILQRLLPELKLDGAAATAVTQ